MLTPAAIILTNTSSSPGFIGIEIAAVLVEQGIEVTVLEANSRICRTILSNAILSMVLK
ncbi:NAD-binding protein [Acinetobacter guillouiae]|uniref:FAD/NAD(P)-binding oxidoreductase n=1 Tax=Acinetobacter TaxID=469 RepID=UPI0032611650